MRKTWEPGGPPLFPPSRRTVVPREIPEDCAPIFAANEVLTWDRPLPYLFMAVFLAIPLYVLFLVVRGTVRTIRDIAGWSTGRTRKRREPVIQERRRPAPRSELAAIRETDPDFSLVLFEDFLFNLYTQAHTVRGRGELDRLLHTHLTGPARAALMQLGADPVAGVIIGAMRIDRVERTAERWTVEVVFETNYTESPPGRSPRAFYCVERWTLTRGGAVRSRPPERVRALGCPSCGAPVEAVIASTCNHCGTTIDGSRFDWQVAAIAVEQREPRVPDLTGSAPEVGTDLPTVRVEGGAERLLALDQREPGCLAALRRRVEVIFSTLQPAWSNLRWDDARPILSDSLHHAQTYWIAAYRASGLRNRNDHASLLGQELVDCTSDRWYDSVTLRIRASGLDYTQRELTGEIVGGSDRQPRTYSEYWTLIRGRATDRTGATCPQCGAPLEINMAGDCKHCDVHLTTAAFDWVLSRIEQDESYRA